MVTTQERCHSSLGGRCSVVGFSVSVTIPEAVPCPSANKLNDLPQSVSPSTSAASFKILNILPYVLHSEWVLLYLR